MTENRTKCPRLEQRSVIKSFTAELCKPYIIYRRMWDVYGEACFSKILQTSHIWICYKEPKLKRQSL